MPCAQYRIYFNGTAATADQLSRFEDITIDQRMDQACEARFEVPVCTTGKGMWDGETEAFLQGMSRIRLELQSMGSDWIPLIDGPIVNVEASMYSEPGQSKLTLVVTDDSFFLHRDETVTSFEGADDEIARQIFNQVPQIADTDVDTTPSPSKPGFTTTVLRGTQMECLRQLARRQRMHVYVACGDKPGRSIGCFKLDPNSTKDYGLAPLVLLGDGRNVFSFESTQTAGQIAIFQTGQVNLGDRSSDTRTSNLSDLDLQGTQLPEGQTIRRLLAPGQSDALTLARAVQGAMERAAYALRASGEVMKDTYGSVLQPYQYVEVLGVNGVLSGTWLIEQVTHTLTRNSYGQTFQVVRNAQSAGANSPAPQIPAGIF
jgi:hypothetical protein